MFLFAEPKALAAPAPTPSPGARRTMIDGRDRLSMKTGRNILLSHDNHQNKLTSIK
jgi:hypothetical protein